MNKLKPPSSAVEIKTESVKSEPVKENQLKPTNQRLDSQGQDKFAPSLNTKAVLPIKKKGFHFRRGVSDLKLVFAIRHLAIMLKSGLALEGAMTILAEQIDDWRLQEIFTEILVDIRNGISIAESMKKHRDVFNNLIISLISSGEQGGTLEKNLLILSSYLKKSHEMKQKVKGALVYPLIVFGMTGLEMIGVIYFLLPKLEGMFSAFGNVPEFTQFVLKASAFMRDNTLAIVIIGTILGVILTMFLNKTKAGKHFKDRVALGFPVFKNLNKNNILATFSQTFALLLDNGIPINDSLKIASETSDNTIYSDALNNVTDSVMSGMSMSNSLAVYPKLFPVTYIKMVEIGEQTGSLSETLIYVYEFYAEEAAEISNNLATLLEPILLIFIGVMIGGLAMIIIGPIYQLMGTING